MEVKPPMAGVNVPILGQATIHGYLGPQIIVTCCCEAKTPMAIPGFGAVCQCQACQRAWTVYAFRHDARTNEGQIEVGPAVIPPGMGVQ